MYYSKYHKYIPVGYGCACDPQKQLYAFCQRGGNPLSDNRYNIPERQNSAF